MKQGAIPAELFERVVAFRKVLSAQMRGSLSILQEHELTLAQALALFHIGENGPTGVGELAGAIGRSQSSTSHLVEQLEQRKLLLRRRSDSDGRRTEVHLTKSGQRIMDKVEAVRRRGLERALAGVPPQLIEQLSESLGAVLASLKTE